MFTVIEIPSAIEVGGFTYQINSEPNQKLLQTYNNLGETDNLLKIIRVDTSWNKENITKVFIHELLEAINYVYCDNHMEHRDIQGVSQGLLQIFKQLNISFYGGE